VRLVFLSALLIWFLIADSVSPSFAETRIYIAGIDPSSAYPNGTVRVYGGGATPKGEVVAMLSAPVNEFVSGNNTGPWIIVGSSNLTLGSTLAGDSGDWEISFLTPNVFPADYNVYVFDRGSLTGDVISFRVLIHVTVLPVLPGLNITYWPSNVTVFASNMTGQPLLFLVAGSAVPSSGPSGSFVTMSGRLASGGELDVYFDDFHVATVVGQQGSWSVPFQVPNVSVGNHTIRAIDAGGRWMSVTQFYVTAPVISLSTFSFSFFGLFAVAVLSGSVVFMFLIMLCRKRKK
jgi:hypothetical protein